MLLVADFMLLKVLDIDAPPLVYLALSAGHSAQAPLLQ
jgi:hypothetical protein